MMTPVPVLTCLEEVASTQEASTPVHHTAPGVRSALPPSSPVVPITPAAADELVAFPSVNRWRNISYNAFAFDRSSLPPSSPVMFHGGNELGAENEEVEVEFANNREDSLEEQEQVDVVNPTNTKTEDWGLDEQHLGENQVGDDDNREDTQNEEEVQDQEQEMEQPNYNGSDAP